MSDPDARSDKTVDQLHEEIEERLRDLVDVGEHPEDVLAYVEGITEKMRREIWET